MCVCLFVFVIKRSISYLKQALRDNHSFLILIFLPSPVCLMMACGGADARGGMQIKNNHSFLILISTLTCVTCDGGCGGASARGGERSKRNQGNAREWCCWDLSEGQYERERGSCLLGQCVCKNGAVE